ncbi:hypothetical protein BO71DRAFT_475215 [Aspergillus ellipticus CBS 707.79]|uniref:Phosphoribosyltransferase domain-containing protein n=1 Tax=Aspergillus ellipticus CBS 707.79 TaxID=1448320 RepID=A0A319F362_9EURO|nr:hypothetical protein BO71DRAFT_475215 [Aspergillus ellipticus CBS 707.79]
MHTSGPPPKPTIIGIYGVPGSGKSFLLTQLKPLLNGQHFAFYEGSEVINTVVPGGLPAFQAMHYSSQEHYRHQAICSIREECRSSGRAGIVTGHYMFWDDASQQPKRVMTSSDIRTYTHIIYLERPADVVHDRREKDAGGNRSKISISHLTEWIEREESGLRRLCLMYGILYTVAPDCLSQILALVRDFQLHDEAHNQNVAKQCIDDIVAVGRADLEKVLVFDGDRTLAPVDTGKLFWDTFDISLCGDALKGLLGILGYSYVAFRHATLFYEAAMDEPKYDSLCQEVASQVTMYPGLAALMELLSKHRHIRIVVVTCGLRRVWQKVLAREGLSDTVKVIGGGRVSDGYVVTPEVKGALVDHLKTTHQLEVWAFGDSPSDIPMLTKADRAIVIVGEREARSSTMDAALKHAVEIGGLWAQQMLFPDSVPPRLDAAVLPIVRLDDYVPEGPRLREAHRRAGWYLAVEYLSELIGVEECDIVHVQGHGTTGHRLANQERTLIVALMRGGEPMAFGINDAMEGASFLHAFEPRDVRPNRLRDKTTVVLVDSVVNSGRTSTIAFFRHIRRLKKDIRIVVVAGVVQAQAVAPNSRVRALARDGGLTVVALRVSDNKYIGPRHADTGNRLFNTMDLP